MDDALSRDLVDVSRQPEQFIQRSTALQQRLKDVIKRLFDTTKREEADSVSGQSFGPLPELYVDGFDAEQIWEELQLRAFPFLKHAEDESKQLITTLNNNSGVIVAGARKSKARNRSDGVSARSGGHFNDDGGDDRARDDDGDDDDDDDDNNDGGSGGVVDEDAGDSSSSDGEDFGPNPDDAPTQHATTTNKDTHDSGTSGADDTTASATPQLMDFLAQMDAFAEQEERKEYGGSDDDDSDKDGGDGDDDDDDDDDDWQNALFSGASMTEAQAADRLRYQDAVSYTHLTLPTIYSV